MSSFVPRQPRQAEKEAVQFLSGALTFGEKDHAALRDAARDSVGNNLVDARQKTHGDFVETGAVAQEIKTALRESSGWASLSPTRREALEKIAAKMARVVCGDAGHRDHWDDIAGYAELGR